MKMLIFMSKPASYFVGRFSSVGPSAENFVVRTVLRRATEVFPFKALQFFDHPAAALASVMRKRRLPSKGNSITTSPMAAISFQAMNCITRFIRRFGDC